MKSWNDDPRRHCMHAGRITCAAVATLAVTLAVGPADGGSFPAEIDLSDLLIGDGSEGTIFRGQSLGAEFAFAGTSLTGTADLNGDGRDDLLIGGLFLNGQFVEDDFRGPTFIVFGRAGGFQPIEELGDLLSGGGGDGSHGFALIGGRPTGDFGAAIAGGRDINGDGLPDLLIGEPTQNDELGRAHLVFGSTEGYPAQIDMERQLQIEGFGVRLIGARRPALTGASTAMGDDANGDGLDDFLIGAPLADAGGAGPRSGATYLLFGRTTPWPTDFPLSQIEAAGGGDGTLGLVLTGAGTNHQAGTAVALIDDVNGDGLADVLVGAPTAPGADDVPAGGAAFLVYPASGNPGDAEVDLADLLSENGGDGSKGTVFHGSTAGERTGSAVSAAGDVNGDGHPDLLFGAPQTDTGPGLVYLVYGRAGSFPAQFDLGQLREAAGGDGSLGSVLLGAGDNELTGAAIAGVGDLNGDGYGDLLIGARLGDPQDRADAGAAYLVFGRDGGLGAEFALADLLAANGGDGSRGVFVKGIDPGDQAGFSVGAAGDVNGDGVDDALIGAPFADRFTNQSLGEAYLLYGRLDGAVTIGLDGADALLAICQNTTDVQRALIPLPEVSDSVVVDCEAAGISFASGEGLRLILRATRTAGAVAGSVGSLHDPRVLCIENASLDITSPPIAGDGAFDCSAAGFEVPAGAGITVVVVGVVP